MTIERWKSKQKPKDACRLGSSKWIGLVSSCYICEPQLDWFNLPTEPFVFIILIWVHLGTWYLVRECSSSYCCQLPHSDPIQLHLDILIPVLGHSAFGDFMQCIVDISYRYLCNSTFTSPSSFAFIAESSAWRSHGTRKTQARLSLAPRAQNEVLEELNITFPFCFLPLDPSYQSSLPIYFPRFPSESFIPVFTSLFLTLMSRSFSQYLIERYYLAITRKHWDNF